MTEVFTACGGRVRISLAQWTDELLGPEGEGKAMPWMCEFELVMLDSLAESKDLGKN